MTMPNHRNKEIDGPERLSVDEVCQRIADTLADVYSGMDIASIANGILDKKVTYDEDGMFTLR